MGKLNKQIYFNRQNKNKNKKEKKIPNAKSECSQQLEFGRKGKWGHK